jgi:hypothetical protein
MIRVESPIALPSSSSTGNVMRRVIRNACDMCPMPGIGARRRCGIPL